MNAESQKTPERSTVEAVGADGRALTGGAAGWGESGGGHGAFPPGSAFATMRGSVLVVVNPAAQNGEGARAAAWLRERAQADGETDRIGVVETERPGHAAELARRAGERGVSAVVACGGDGVFHEALQGLMAAPRSARPAFGVLPCGNGNDFARTVGMPRTGVADAWRALQDASPRAFDVGVCNGEFFLQTLSFGVDAAIALGTRQLRERTGREGTRLFLEEGVDQLLHHRDVFECTLRLPDAEGVSTFPDAGGAPSRTVRAQVHLMAVQLGPTYGGGFAVCPGARPDDGAFDVCLCRAPLGFVHAGFLFLLAKNGRHQRFTREFSFYRAPSLRVEFDREPPVQIDGEPLHGAVFDVRTVPAALDVLVPPASR